jgi:autotransporter-associated beta strand protein
MTKRSASSRHRLHSLCRALCEPLEVRWLLNAPGTNYPNHMVNTADLTISGGEPHLTTRQGAGITVNGGSTPDSIRLVRNGALLDVYINNTSTTPDAEYDYAGVTSVAGLDGNDTIVLDYSAGDPVTPGGLNIDGGAGTDTILVTGLTGSTAVLDSGTTLTIGGNDVITYINTEAIEFANGSNTLGSTNPSTTQPLAIDIDAGSALTLATGAVLPSTADFNVDGTLDLSSQNESIDQLTGGGTVSLGSGQLTVGAAGGSSTFAGSITGAGGITKTGTGSFTLAGANTYTGATTISIGTLTVTGSINANDTANIGQIIVGNVSGNAQLIVAGTVNATSTGSGHWPSIVVGTVSGANGSILVNSGVLTTTNELWLSSVVGAYGAMTINSGSVTLGSWLALCRGGGVGMLDQNGGSLTVLTNNISVGSIVVGSANNGDHSVANLTGGTTTVTNGGLYAGELTPGVVNVSGSAMLNLNGTLGISVGGSAVNATSTLNLNGGTIVTSQVTSSAVVNLNGATLKVRANNADFLNAASTVFGGGAIIDTNGNSVVGANQPLQSPTGNGVTGIGLTSNGTGYVDAPVVTIKGGRFAFTDGATAVANFDPATGQVTGITITNPGNYSSTVGLSVTFTGGGGTPPTVGGITTAVNTSGGVTKNGSGELLLNGQNTYGGNTVVNAGLLMLDNVTNGSNLILAGNATTQVAGNGQVIVGSLSGPSSSSVLVNSGSTLAINSATGTFAGTMSVGGGGTVKFPGSTGSSTTLSLGTLNLGNATIGTSATALTPMTLQVSNLTFGGTIDVSNNILIAPGTAADAEKLINTTHHVTTSAAGLVLGYGATSSSNFEVRATLLGDSDLDGKVNVTDLANLAGNFGKTGGQFWLNGDFDYNGNVNVADLADLAGNFGQSLSGSTATATPMAAASSAALCNSSAIRAEPPLSTTSEVSSRDSSPALANGPDSVYSDLQVLWSDARIVA